MNGWYYTDFAFCAMKINFLELLVGSIVYWYDIADRLWAPHFFI